MSKVTPTAAEIKAWLKREKSLNKCGMPVFQSWDRKLWHKPYNEIVDFLIERFKSTLSEPEYYMCMLYLGKDLPKEALHVPFKKSPQYMQMLTGGLTPTQEKTTRMSMYEPVRLCMGLSTTLSKEVRI